jgi:hypothetical protein
MANIQPKLVRLHTTKRVTTEWRNKRAQNCGAEYRRTGKLPTTQLDNTGQIKYFERELLVMYLNRIHSATRKRLQMAIEAAQNGEIDVSDITNEVNLARLTAEDAAELYSLVEEMETAAAKLQQGTPEEMKQAEKGLQAKIYVGDILTKKLREVAGLAEQHARIRQIKQDIKDISTLQELFKKVGEIAVRTIPDKGILKAFLVELRAMSIDDGTQGTTLRADDDVREMDNTIPRSSSEQMQ